MRLISVGILVWGGSGLKRSFYLGFLRVEIEFSVVFLGCYWGISFVVTASFEGLF